jgi:hypothetical protein
LLAAALAAAGVFATPMLAGAADDGGPRLAQAAAASDEPAAMRDHDGPGMRGGPMMRHMMMHGMHGMMRGDPRERCADRLAWRAARRAYVEAKLDLTAEQRPLWDNLQNAAKAEEQKERQLCAALKPEGSPTLIDRMDRMQQFLTVRLDGLQAAKPAVQALYQALTPDQRAILDHPFRRP